MGRDPLPVAAASPGSVRCAPVSLGLTSHAGAALALLESGLAKLGGGCPPWSSTVASWSERGRGRVPRLSPASTERRSETAACTLPLRRNDLTLTLPVAPTGQRE